MPDKITKLSPAQTQVHALAPVIQRWAELCQTHADLEPSAALTWYLQGRADAHAMDAARLRETISPTTLNDPPKQGLAFIKAYETLLEMMHAIAQPGTPLPPAPPNDDTPPE